MIKEQRNGRVRKRLVSKEKHTVWYESDKKGGFIIFAGIKGTDIQTYAGSATSRDALEYKIRMAKRNFGLPVN